MEKTPENPVTTKPENLERTATDKNKKSKGFIRNQVNQFFS